MTVTLDVSGDWEVMDNRETVTYHRRTSHTAFAAGVSVPESLREVVEAFDPRALNNIDVVWNLWEENISGVTPKQGDVVEDAAGARWVVDRARYATLQSRWQLDCKRER